MKADRISEEANQRNQGAPFAKTPSAFRSGLIRAVFELCDTDGDGLLSESQMLVFACFTGYEGSAEQWKDDFRHLCTDLGADPGTGLNILSLEKLVNNSGEGGLYCTDDELQTIRVKMEHKVKMVQMSTDNERANLISAVFKGCDCDEDGHLNEQEMRIISNHLGFEGTDEQWSEEFQLLCSENGVDPGSGVGPALAERLLNDQSDSGCFCSDEELRSLLTKLEDPAEKAKLVVPKPKSGNQKEQDLVASELRSDIIGAVFRACDADRDGRLSEKEMRGFAIHTGFRGTEEEWSKEYQSLCGASASSEMDLELFEKLVNDRTDKGCYCTYEEMKTILDKIRLDLHNNAFMVQQETPKEAPKAAEEQQPVQPDATAPSDSQPEGS